MRETATMSRDPGNSKVSHTLDSIGVELEILGKIDARPIPSAFLKCVPGAVVGEIPIVSPGPATADNCA